MTTSPGNNQATKPRVISLPTPDGDIKWRPYADRIRDMQEKYPAPDYGWESEVRPWAGREDMVWVTARLVHHPRNGESYTVNERSSFGPIRKVKDFEKIETAAHQRLFAALDCQGTVFDEDERAWAMDNSEVPWGNPQGSGASTPQTHSQNHGEPRGRTTRPQANDGKQPRTFPPPGRPVPQFTS